ncbi:MAG: Co2+/Mg2+ efflux protein ApaG [Candidatus Marinimicrobia bacterium]|jgi:ApaG protein|nr:Co2+/Mg2+ efflux protein ApaG [Candidatus Neomarinimicrobiota bacterium]MBT3617326.1 Co2+/Mg2+ efflux protein ApaG [Candidatus Neomarinimicrobiota bacterium]MBT3829266.1 Co2+/Mg2+ efflux protein ApaG [Candidatus Neomarinimicrobiota bacterium]MBT3998224.1 Co2+/Mg2+ efflux protein ApaG [Candidatus Neomarinimicrobiota bacterium]MBT4281525.1 Co2+/Mg2+ efflux protein ApaG [Candidatus Neomarinimicrobiota bacterium]
MATTITNGIRIEVKSSFLPERSNPPKPLFVFAYHITITNDGNHPVKLKDRYWHITDANGNIEEIRGPGVVGNQPRLQNNDIFEYTSYCPLPTAFGVMKGAFRMIRDSGESFLAKIDPFKLSVPFSVN